MVINPSLKAEERIAPESPIEFHGEASSKDTLVLDNGILELW